MMRTPLILMLLLLAACQANGKASRSSATDEIVGLWCSKSAIGYAKNTYREIRKTGEKFEIYAIGKDRNDNLTEVFLSSPKTNGQRLEIAIGGGGPEYNTASGCKW